MIRPIKIAFSFIFLMIIMVQSSKALVVFINHGVFRNDEKTSFVEIYYKIPLSSVTIGLQENGKFQASLNVEINYYEKDSLVFSRLYNLVSPEIADTSNLNFALTDLKRTELPYGNYLLKMKITDNLDTLNKTIFATIIDTKFTETILSFSNVQFADTIYSSGKQTLFTRASKEIIPNVFNAYSFNQPNLFFYTEFYNATQFIKTESLFVKYYIKKDSIIIPDREKIVKQSVTDANYVIGTLDLRNLQEGVYDLVVEVYNLQNKLLRSCTSGFSIQQSPGYYPEMDFGDSKQLFAQLVRSYSTEQIKEYLNYLYTISDFDELSKAKLLENETNHEELVIFFYEFWVDKDSLKPAITWLDYLTKIEECNRMFSTTLRKGYKTERGRVYLEYGAPNSISESSNALMSYPYQIWHYYKLGETQQNKKFVFFNRTGALNEYELIHSDAIGEPKNEKWKDVVRKFNNLGAKQEKVFGDFLDNDFEE